MCRPCVDAERLLGRLDQLRRIGATGSGGVTRLAYTPDDVAARTLVGEWLAEAGASVTVDPAANLIGRRAGSEGIAALAAGSHLDTVVEGGALDGAFGVLAALEGLAALRDAGTTLRHDLWVVAFANEEGTRGLPPMAGSRAVAGTLSSTEAGSPGDDGLSLAACLAAAGAGDGDARWAMGDVDGYLEVHIEQGPVLAGRGLPVGVVNAITGRATLEITVEGCAGHAGTTPMDLRQDALTAAARMVLAVESLAVDGHVRVATTGQLSVWPGVRNVIPGSVRLGAEVRDADPARLAGALPRLADRAAAIEAGTGTRIRLSSPTLTSPVGTDPGLRTCIRQAADSLGLGWMDLPSGAGHDAQIVAQVAPVAMIFVPSTGGTSHNPQEHTHPADLVAGAEVLLATLLLADQS